MFPSLSLARSSFTTRHHRRGDRTPPWGQPLDTTTFLVASPRAAVANRPSRVALIHLTMVLPPGKTRYPLYRRLGGPQGRSGREENLVPTGIRSRIVQLVVSRYTNWATRPTYYREYANEMHRVWCFNGSEDVFFYIPCSSLCRLIGRYKFFGRKNCRMRLPWRLWQKDRPKCW